MVLNLNYYTIYNLDYLDRARLQNVSIQAPVLAVSWSTRRGNRTACLSVECFNTRQVTRLSYLQESPPQVSI